MGCRIARGLLAHGADVTVYTRRPDPTAKMAQLGAQVAQTPKSAATEADVIFSIVTDDEASRQVWLNPETGALFGMKAGSLAVECSTLSPKWVAELAQNMMKNGMELMDLPIVGSRPQAETGELVWMAGGSTAAFAIVSEILQPITVAMHHVGPVGHGCRLKLAINALLGIQVAAIAEILGFLEKTGLDQQNSAAIMGTMPVVSPFAKLTSELMIAGRHAPLFPVELAAKDLRYMIEAAQDAGAAVPTVSSTMQTFDQAIEASYGPENISAVTKLYQD